MKIAQILPELNVGGVETGTVDLAKALKKRGHEPYVISNGGKLVGELVKAGIAHLQLPVHEKSFRSLRLIRDLASFLERERIDIIHARSRVPAWLAYLAVRRTNCDFVTTCHGYYSKHFLSRVMGWGKRVIVTSHSIGRRMIDDFGVSPGRITLIHRGVDLDQYVYWKEKYDQKPASTFKIINIGRITPIKGHEEFIRAVHLLSKRLPNIEASIVGAPDRGKESYFRQLKVLVSRLGLKNQIKFLGARRDVPELVRSADLLVLSSKIPEAFGRVLIEAGAVGTVAIASRIGGILDVIDHEENGLLFSPENFEEMAVTMERLLRDRPRCKQLAANLRQKVEQEFSLNQMVQKTCQVYSEVRQQKKILITKLGALGDLILCIPSFRMIRERFPNASISLLTDSKLLPVVQQCPYIDEFMTYDRTKRTHTVKRLFKLGKWLRGRGFDLAIDFQNSWRTHVIAFLARVPKRFGYRRGWTGSLLTHPVVHWDRGLSPVAHQFQVLRRLGVTQMDDRMELWSNAAVDEQVARQLNTDGAGKVRIGFVLGASVNWPTKQWPIEYFRTLADRLIEQTQAEIYLIGAKEDRGLAERFLEAGAQHITDLTGKTNLSELMSVMKQLDVLVTGDTAPLHVASAFETKIVALFGPTDPIRHMPPGEDHVVLVKRLPCQPCYQGVCHNAKKLECLRDISVSEAFDAVSNQLGKRGHDLTPFLL